MQARLGLPAATIHRSKLTPEEALAKRMWVTA
jgi:hypothetical protein